jgi:hypothetical protein
VQAGFSLAFATHPAGAGRDGTAAIRDAVLSNL